jgi:tRNA U34 2-thiouridine synthase MnmA/TrmU
MKAIILLSGGLDSTITAGLMKREGLSLVAVNYKTPFCLCDRRSHVEGCGGNAKKVTDALGIELRIISATNEYLEIIKKPKHGYGGNMNPCIDCRILFFKKSKEVMDEVGASFIITGEVLGQRPMSQFRRQMDIIEKESGLEGLIVRPLSAKLLPPTIPEKMGWIKRENMLNIEGRSRKMQIAMAKELGINDYPCAAGGCLLTDAGFSRKVKDLIKHNEFNIQNIQLLKLGRYFRLSDKAKLVVGRNEEGNNILARLAMDGDYIFRPASVNGPTAIGRGVFNLETIEQSCKIVARYCDRNNGDITEISYRIFPQSEEKTVGSYSLDEEKIIELRV